jgi:hypothetical protein
VVSLAVKFIRKFEHPRRAELNAKTAALAQFRIDGNNTPSLLGFLSF